MTSLVTESGVACHVTGEGPALLLISGLGGHASFWQPVVAGLEGEFKVLTLDHPGVGKSAPVETHSIKAIATAAIEVMDLCRVEKAVVVGHSTGSLVAQTLALDERARFNGMVLSGGWARADKRFRDLFLFRRHVMQTLGSRAYSVLSGLLSYPNEIYNSTIASETPPDLRDPHVDDEVTVPRIDMLMSYSRAEELSGLSIKTLVIGATDDQVVPYDHSRDLARRVPNAQLETMTGGHFFPKTQAQQYIDNVRNFMGQV